MKAFLSHSSVNKEFVRKVAIELGRQFCIIDEQAFATGDEFKKAIVRSLDDSSVFVLFASREALKSVWVDFEIEEAAYKKLYKSLSSAVVYQIDPGIQISDYPEWLRRAKIRKEIVPSIIARDIRHRLDECLRERQQHIYIPRTNETESVTSIVTSVGRDQPVRIFMVSGLPGLGRRTLVRRVVPPLLNLQRAVEITVASGDTLHDIAIKFADKAEPYSTPAGLEHIVEQIRALPEDRAAARIIDNVRVLQSAGELLVLVDNDGMVDNDGVVRDHIAALLRKFLGEADLYCVLVATRMPRFSDDLSIPRVPILPLSEENTKRLLTLSGRHAGVTLNPQVTGELAEFVAGYPPAAFYAINQAKVYGLEVVLNDKRNLVEFRSAVFLKHLTKLQLDDVEKKLIQLLSAFSPLPFKVVVSVTSLAEPERTANILIRLVDLSLIYVDESGNYRISDPIASAVDRVLGFPPHSTNVAVSEALDAYVKEVSGEEVGRGLLDIMRVSFRAARWSGREHQTKALVGLTSDVYRLVEEFFHAREYERAIEFAFLAIKQGIKSQDIYYFLIRSLINLERWGELEPWVAEYAKVAPKRDVDYILGYYARKRGDIKEAIRLFKSSESGGRRGTGLGRELALCYMLEKNFGDAKKYLDTALSADPDNRFLVDLGIQLATITEDREGARTNLERLRLVDSETFYFHRLSCVELAFGDKKQALTAATQAYRQGKPPFSILAQLIVCEIETGDLGQAENHLNEIERSFKGYADIKAGLHCKLELARHRYNDALGWLERAKNNTHPAYLYMKVEALKGLLTATALSDGQRKEYQRQLPLLETELAKVKKVDLALIP